VVKMRLNTLLSIGIFIASILILVACQAGAKQENAKRSPQAARLVEPNDKTFAKIKSVIESSLNGVQVQLASRYFVESSWLTIERTHKRNIQNKVPLGRSYEVPITFQLLKMGDECLLRKGEQENLLALKQIKCEAIKKDE